MRRPISGTLCSIQNARDQKSSLVERNDSWSRLFSHATGYSVRRRMTLRAHSGPLWGLNGHLTHKPPQWAGRVIPYLCFFSIFLPVWLAGGGWEGSGGRGDPAGCGGLSRERFVAFLNSETENRPSWRGTIPRLGFAHTIVEVPLAENGPPRPIWPTVRARSGIFCTDHHSGPGGPF